MPPCVAACKLPYGRIFREMSAPRSSLGGADSTMFRTWTMMSGTSSMTIQTSSITSEKVTDHVPIIVHDAANIADDVRERDR